MIEICEVEGCDKEATFVDLCSLHRKKALLGALEEDPDGTIWDTCSKGHRWTPENTHWERTPNGGRRRRCKRCLILKAARKRGEEPVVSVPNPVQPKNEEMRRALHSFDKVQVRIRGNCYGKWDQWTDYTEQNMPTREEAQSWCEGCPLLASCGNAAAATEPGWGVWAGEVWVYGQKWDHDPGKLDHDD